ncbi:chromosome partitioning protein ParA [Vibrio sp. SCSIO 43136]|uniref:chromosome partitioning protein ParA n=1 Tax=Vibrio sp. SCSIO 43136 TaxID=2819101 RepID=UPI002075F3AA|nr:chromosome partitioning protein ParA [Vibrio sp. SCSIO 43136]USD64524.1 chromosome partitioning protein ParA [Vibrio sp. SCSIO 43136]
MVSIQGLPPARVGQTNKTNKKSKVNKQSKQPVAETTKVATAVAQTIRHVDESQINGARIQYDLPEGRSRKAMQEYMDVMNQAKRDELAKLMGVDLYI